MTIKEQMKQDLQEARLAKENDGVTKALQLTLSKIQTREIDAKRELKDSEVIAIIKKEIKDNEETIDILSVEMNNPNQSAERKEALGERYVSLISINEKYGVYVPQQLTEEQIIQLLINKGAQKGDNIGKLIGMVMSTHKEVVDGNLVREVVRKHFQQEVIEWN